MWCPEHQLSLDNAFKIGVETLGKQLAVSLTCSPVQLLGPAHEGPAAVDMEDDAAPNLEVSASQSTEQGSRRPVSGERAFLLTVAQRAKEAAAAGAAHP